MQTFKLHKKEEELVKLIMQASKTLGVDSFIVGGFVRDRLIGRPTKDLDIVCVGSGIALAEQVAELLSPKPKVSVFKRFGTAMLRAGDIEVEFVGARKESYQKDSRKPVVEDGTIQDDQNRRDFTINALAVSLQEENYLELIDPFNGLSDLVEGIIRTPLKPRETFSDDPLRMMRAIRFATQLDFYIEDKTFDSIYEERERINIISAERISDELNKIILSPKPSIGFELLYECELLDIIFPEMVALHGVEVKYGMGHKDNFYHTLEVLDNICAMTDDLWLRWSAILHDIAKPPTKRFDPKVGWTFHGHDALGAKMVPKIFKRFRLPLDHKMKYVQKLVRLHLRPISLTKESISDSALRRLLYDAGPDLEDLMTLCKADITSKNPQKVRKYLDKYTYVQQRLIELEEKDHLREWQPPISGKEIMQTFGLRPSREVGLIKDAIKEAILDGKCQNNYDSAHALMLEEGEKLGLKMVGPETGSV